MFEFDKQDYDKCSVRLSIEANEKSASIDNEYSYDVPWTEVIEDVVKALESFYGYSFGLTYKDGEAVGIYYDGRDDD